MLSGCLAEATQTLRVQRDGILGRVFEMEESDGDVQDPRQVCAALTGQG